MGRHRKMTKELPCYDCGSTHTGMHTPLCAFAGKHDKRILPQVPGTQWWIGAGGQSAHWRAKNPEEYKRLQSEFEASTTAKIVERHSS